jgi:hypothetical protein
MPQTQTSYRYILFSLQQHDRVSFSTLHGDGTDGHRLTRRFRGILFHQHYRDRPNLNYSLLVVTLSLLRAITSGPKQLGLVPKNVK